MDLGLILHGFSFHVGSPCRELNAFSRGIGICRRLIAIAKSMGCKNVQLIDIGGGFPGERGMDIDKVRGLLACIFFFYFTPTAKIIFQFIFKSLQLANIINDAIQDLDPSIRVISEPGRYYVESAFTLVSFLHSKKIVYKNGNLMRMYYANVGTYNSFLDEMIGLESRKPQILFEVLITYYESLKVIKYVCQIPFCHACVCVCV